MYCLWVSQCWASLVPRPSSKEGSGNKTSADQLIWRNSWLSCWPQRASNVQCRHRYRQTLTCNPVATFSWTRGKKLFGDVVVAKFFQKPVTASFIPPNTVLTQTYAPFDYKPFPAIHLHTLYTLHITLYSVACAGVYASAFLPRPMFYLIIHKWSRKGVPYSWKIWWGIKFGGLVVRVETAKLKSTNIILSRMCNDVMDEVVLLPPSKWAVNIASQSHKRLLSS